MHCPLHNTKSRIANRDVEHALFAEHARRYIEVPSIHSETCVVVVRLSLGIAEKHDHPHNTATRAANLYRCRRQGVSVSCLTTPMPTFSSLSLVQCLEMHLRIHKAYWRIRRAACRRMYKLRNAADPKVEMRNVSLYKQHASSDRPRLAWPTDVNTLMPVHAYLRSL